MSERWNLPLAALLAVVALGGCGAPVAEFRRYETYARKQEKELGLDTKTSAILYPFSAQYRQDVDDVLVALYGTPDAPTLPVLTEVDISQLVDINLLRLAAGPVGSDETGRPTGLYREHCAHCHGVTGDGNGPTAIFLNPYPRDYRPGRYKFKSTPFGQRPTHDDLKKTLIEGIPGTAMPSFRLLPEQEIEALIHYVKYLSLRGETEQMLYRKLTELEENDRLIDPSNPKPEKLEEIRGMVTAVAGNWLAAAEAVTVIEKRPDMTPEQLAASRTNGQKLFYGAGNCFSCHGPTALGDGQTSDYDEWVKDFAGKTPKPEDFAEWVAVGMLPPRNIRPRNLRQGVYRGGMRPIDLFWRIRNGIEGTPMPGNNKLTNPEVWDLVNYVQSLPYEPISDPRLAEPDNRRERM
jgi:mono/diheme cytochrome c family protein